VQAQWPPAPYVGIWTRTVGFRREALERLLARGAVVKATVMRQTLHLVSRRDYALLRAALSESNHLDQSGDAQAFASSVRPLAGPGPVTTTSRARTSTRARGSPGSARGTPGGARIRAHLLHHPETAFWPDVRRADSWRWPSPNRTTRSRHARRFRRYLAAFGPASRKDIDTWSISDCRRSNRRSTASSRCARFRDEQGRELLDVPRAPLPRPGDARAGALPAEMGQRPASHADRTRVISEPYRKAIVGMNGDIAQTFLVDGFVAGAWRVEQGRVVIEPFGRLSRSVSRELADEAGQLEEFLAL
jgi:hypothetical protein